MHIYIERERERFVTNAIALAKSIMSNVSFYKIWNLLWAVLISIGLWKWLPHHLWFWREICPFSRSTFGDKFDEFSFATLSYRNKCTALERNAEKSHAGHAFQKQVVDALVRYVSLSRYVALLEVAKGQNNRDELENKLSCRWTNQQNFRGKREGRWEDLEGRL